MSGDIYAALAAIQGEVGVVGKTRQNPQQGYKFRGIDDVMAHVQALQAQHGVICVPRVVEREREMVPTKSGGTMASVRLVIDHHFYAKDGSSVVCTTMGEAMDSGDKASNKAMSAALKYALVETYMIPTYEADRDTEEQSPVMAGAPSAKPKATPPKAAAPAPAPDDLEREKAALRAAFAAAPNVAALDALWTRVKALPTVDVAELTVDFKANKTRLRGAA
jgi:hypothetical protein